MVCVDGFWARARGGCLVAIPLPAAVKIPVFRSGAAPRIFAIFPESIDLICQRGQQFNFPIARIRPEERFRAVRCRCRRRSDMTT